MKMRKILALFTAICVCLVSAVSVSAATVTYETDEDGYGEFTSFNYDVKANIINITAQLADTSKASDVMVKITEDNTNNVIALKQFKSNNAGFVNVSFVLNTDLYDVDGANDATLRVAADKTNIAKVSGIKLFSATELSALENFNSVVDVDDPDPASLESFLNTNKDILGIAGFDSATVPRDVYNIEMLCGFIKDDYTDPSKTDSLADVINMVADILDKLNRTNVVLDAINVETQRADNEINGNEIKRLLTNPTNADIIFDQSGARVINCTELYARLARDAQGNKAVYYTMDQLEEAFTAACAAQELADREKGGQVLENGNDFVEDAWLIKTVANVVMISGAIETTKTEREDLTIYITDMDSTRIVHAEQVKTNQDGTFSLTLPLNAARLNDLVVPGATEPVYLDLFISAAGYDEWQFYIPVFNGADITNMMNLFKDGISSVAQIKDFFAPAPTGYREIHGIGQGYTIQMYDILFDIYQERVSDYVANINNCNDVATAVVALNDTMNATLSFLDDINYWASGKHWAMVYASIQTDHATLAEDYNKYATLLNKVNNASLTLTQNKALYLEMATNVINNGEYQSVEAVDDAFDIAYNNATASTPAPGPGPTPSPGGGGTGGGSGGGTYIPGDINGDGVVGTKDVTVLRRYIAGGYDVTVVDATVDVNCDGTVTTKDTTTLRRFIAGGYGIELK